MNDIELTDLSLRLTDPQRQALLGLLHSRGVYTLRQWRLIPDQRGVAGREGYSAIRAAVAKIRRLRRRLRLRRGSIRGGFIMLDWLKTLCVKPENVYHRHRHMCEPFTVMLDGRVWSCATNAKAMVLVAGTVGGVSASDAEVVASVVRIFKPSGPQYAVSLEALKRWLGLYTSPEQCPTCHGQPETVCPICKGRQKERCGECFGHRRTVCPHCDQDMDCEECGGTGKVDCSRCGGDGKVWCGTCDVRGQPDKILAGDLFGAQLDKRLLARYLDRLSGDTVTVHVAKETVYVEGPGWWVVLCQTSGKVAADRFQAETAAVAG